MQGPIMAYTGTNFKFELVIRNRALARLAAAADESTNRADRPLATNCQCGVAWPF